MIDMRHSLEKKIDWASLTFPGSREVNEDSVGTVETETVHGFIVADGLGGHGQGDIASQLAVAAFQQTLNEGGDTVTQQLEAAFLLAQRDILAEQDRTKLRSQMKTTMTVLAISGDMLQWGHIGDTRLYGFRHGKIRCRTTDHSVPQMLVMAKEIKEKEIRFHPDRNKLLRVLGVSGEKPRFVLAEPLPRRKFQGFLLCSDGFWELILEKEMCSCLKKAKSAQQWLDAMEQIVRRRGEGKEMDNCSAIAVLL